MGLTARVVGSMLGIWLMCSPSILGYGEPAMDHDHVLGPLIASFAVVAASQVTSGARWINLFLGMWLVVAPWLLAYSEPSAVINSMATGTAVVVSSLFRTAEREQTGGGWRVLFKKTHN